MIDEFLKIQKHDKHRFNSEFGFNFIWFICGANVRDVCSTLRTALLFGYLMLLLFPLAVIVPIAVCLDSLGNFSFEMHIDETTLV